MRPPDRMSCERLQNEGMGNQSPGFPGERKMAFESILLLTVLASLHHAEFIAADVCPGGQVCGQPASCTTQTGCDEYVPCRCQTGNCKNSWVPQTPCVSYDTTAVDRVCLVQVSLPCRIKYKCDHYTNPCSDDTHCFLTAEILDTEYALGWEPADPPRSCG